MLDMATSKVNASSSINGHIFLNHGGYPCPWFKDRLDGSHCAAAKAVTAATLRSPVVVPVSGARFSVRRIPQQGGMLASTVGEQEQSDNATPEHGGRDEALLRVSGLTVRFGGVVALEDVSFDVMPGQIAGVIGPNGAGKTTLFNCLSRLYPFQSGGILFQGNSLLEVPRHRIAEFGIGRTFQNLALFRTMTVLQNIMVGAHSWSRGGFLANALRLPIVAREEARVSSQARELLALLHLESVASSRVADLPFGTQKRVELGRALASRPKLLLLDEPAGGLNHEEVESLSALIGRIRDQLGVTVLLVEHHMGLVMQLSDKVVALNFGKKIAEGSAPEVQRNAEVIRAYLGKAG
jgi:branched-chain amino acid transport system ATP-binding protein